MKWSLLIAAIVLLASCRSHKVALASTETSTTESDSVKIVERILYVPDTVYINIPSQRESVAVSLDSTSTLENDYAISVACITGDGLLRHSLWTKPRVIAAPFLRPEKIVETTSRHNRHDRDKTTQTVEVERDFSWWERFRMSAFWWLVGALALSVGWTNRHWLATLIKKLL